MTNPLLIAFSDSPDSFSAEQRANITGIEAWQFANRDDAAVSTIVNQLSDQIAQRLAVSPQALEIFHADREQYLRRDYDYPLMSVLERAMQHACELKRFDPQEVRENDPAENRVYDAIPSDILTAYNAQRITTNTTRACHAASSSMFFGRNGWISACCVRRQPPYGIWPEKSVADVWFSDHRAQLDRALSENILPHGCTICSDQILAGNFRGTVAHSFDYVINRAPADREALLRSDPGARVYPLRLEFELSNKCNLECAMCSGEFSSLIRQNREHLPPLADVYDDRLVEQLREFVPHLKEADFRGGEPFLIDIYYAIWELLIELNPECIISITSNGTAFSPKIKRVVENLNVHLIFSLDSLHAPTYENIRRNGKLEKTLANIDAFHEIATRRRKTIGFAFCVMQSNWREVPDLLAYASARNASIRMNTVYSPASSSISALPRDEQIRIGTFLRSSVKSPNSQIEAQNNKAVEDFCLQIDHWTDVPVSESLVQIS